MESDPLLWEIRPRQTAKIRTLPKGDEVCAELNLAHARGGVGPLINLSNLNQRQQVPQQPSDPWGLLRVHGRLNRHDRHCRSDLLQG